MTQWRALLGCMLVLWAGASRVDAKTMVSVDGTTITFTVPIEIFIPPEVESSDADGKLKELQDQAYVASAGFAQYFGETTGSSETMGPKSKYKDCYTVLVILQPSVRLQSEEGLPGADSHAFRYDPEQASEDTILDNPGADPYMEGIWGSWNPTAPFEDLFDFGELLDLPDGPDMIDQLGRLAEEQLRQQGIELADCLCIRHESTLRGDGTVRALYEMSVAPKGKTRRVSGSGTYEGAWSGRDNFFNASGEVKVEGRHRKNGTLRLNMEITYESRHGGPAGTFTHRETTKMKLKAGPLDENGSYNARETLPSPSPDFETKEVITMVWRCEVGSP